MQSAKTFSLALLVLIAGCTQPGAETGKVLVDGLQQVQSLDVVVSGEALHLLVAGIASDASVQAHYLHSTDAGRHWQAPVRVDAGSPPPHKPARNIDVQLAVNGEQRVAAWQIAGSGWGGFGPIRTVISSDGGKSWRPGPGFADDTGATDQGFIDMTADPAGVLHAVWLDKRDGKRGLRHARSKDGGNLWHKNRTIVAQTCECCWNRILSAGDALYVSYRADDPRDMHIAASDNRGDEWQRDTTSGEFNWAFDGCPHAGAGLALRQRDVMPDQLHVTVWTGAEAAAGLHYLRSDDGGKSWQKPLALAAAGARHSDVAVSGKRVVAVWHDKSMSGSAIFMAQSADNGKSFRAPEALHCSDATSGSQPRIVAVADGFRVFWTTAAGSLCALNLR